MGPARPRFCSGREFPPRVCTRVVPGVPEPGGPASERAWVRPLPPGPGRRRADRWEEGRETRGRPSRSLARRRAATPQGRGSGDAAPRAADLGGRWPPAGAANPSRAGGVRRLGPLTRRAQSRAEVGVARGPRGGRPCGDEPSCLPRGSPSAAASSPAGDLGTRAPRESPLRSAGPRPRPPRPDWGPSPTTLRPARGPPARVGRPQATHRSDPGAPSVAPPAPRSPQVWLPRSSRPCASASLLLSLCGASQPCPPLCPGERGVLLLPPSALLRSGW
ncbi:nascent polypeptide-associated complex subunit alpha, muscle-specific form-like [Meles meles]|uniref:nascent polypeptide-associated complex subunit alpha, muscle-specific form-like n=1 Tax=Meles meles TaxID=9662 RepID=UPI001E69E792|nr:nascent polypeptide-associated complex subunit alpha, muscle-specific form-like [Meles meles]